jgi:hypothetical protein
MKVGKKSAGVTIPFDFHAGAPVFDLGSRCQSYEKTDNRDGGNSQPSADSAYHVVGQIST